MNDRERVLMNIAVDTAGTIRKATKLTDIVNNMIEQGFANDFEYKAEKPKDGQDGYTTITRDDLLNVLANRQISVEDGKRRKLRTKRDGE